MFLLWLRQLPQCGDQSPASVSPTLPGQCKCPAYTPVFPPSSFTPQSFVWFCIFFPAAQVLLSALSWCSAYISISESVFLMYPWREMYSSTLLSRLVRASTVDVLNSENIGFCGFFFKVKVIWWTELYGLWPPSHWEKDSMHKDKACGQSMPGGSAREVGIEPSTVCSLSADCIQL